MKVTTHTTPSQPVGELSFEQSYVSADAERPNKVAFYNRYLLTVLLVVLAFSYVDRAVFALLQQPIKTDLHFSDSQLGVLNGVGFALFFGIMGIPLARWADRGDRVAIIALTTGIWSASVSLCGTASTFLFLLLWRVCTAVGEAGCGPTANSLLPEYFSRAALPRAVGVYMLGAPLGTAVGYLAGGWLAQTVGWRDTFYIVGVPGLALATLAAISLREPRRAHTKKPIGTIEGAHGNISSNASFKSVVQLFLHQTTLRHLWLCYLIWYFCGWGLQQWLPTFFLRSHGIATKDVGVWFAAASILGGMLGSWLGGELSSRWAANNEQLQLQGTAVLFVLLTFFFGAALVVSDVHVAFGALTLAYLAAAMLFAPLIATIQTLVPSHMRATMLALGTLLPTFIGMGLGPTTAGALSDAIHPFAAEESLRYALLGICPGFCLAAWCAWRASRSVALSL